MFGIILTFLLLIVSFCKKYPAEIAIVFILLPHILTGFVLQALHIFSFWYVCVAYVIFALLCYFAIETYGSKNKVRHYKEIFIGCMLFVSVLCTLTSLHTNFTGIVSTVAGNSYVAEHNYPYPLFSDEWVAVEIIQTTSNEQRLPASDVFFGKPKFNFLFGFHSLLSQLHVFFSVAPLTTYVFFGVLFAGLLVVCAYRLQRVMGVGVIAAACSSFLLLYVTNGSNLPGLWYLLPWNVGFLFLLVGYIFVYRKQYLFTALSFVMALYVYPPIGMFIGFSLLALLLYYRKSLSRVVQKIRNKQSYVLVLSGLLLIGAIVYRDIIFLGIEYLVRPLRSALGTPPLFYPWAVIPVVVLVACLVGLKGTVRKYAFIAYPLFGGCFLWALYWLRVPTIVIDYHRTVMITALLIGTYAGVGFTAIGAYVAKNSDGFKEFMHTKGNILQVAIIIAVTIFAITTSGWYMQRGNWTLLEKKVWDPVQQSFVRISSPLPPVNRYLTEEDFALFAPYSQKTFVAPQWKSLVLAVATDNIPLATKPATFAVNKLSYVEFIKSSCENKTRFVEKYDIGLVYAVPFVCPSFVEVGQSSEGLSLYEFQK